jgi:hypothetical protein
MFTDTRYLCYNIASLAVAYVISKVNVIYDGLKLRGEIKSPAIALAAISLAVKKSDNQNSGGRKGDWKRCKKCNKKHSKVC